jgi:hypothetical protein
MTKLACALAAVVTALCACSPNTASVSGSCGYVRAFAAYLRQKGSEKLDTTYAADFDSAPWPATGPLIGDARWVPDRIAADDEAGYAGRLRDDPVLDRRVQSFVTLCRAYPS